MSSSPSSTCPAVGVSRPATMRSVVVLPQPEGPSRAKKEPDGIVSVRSSTATALPNVFRSPTSRRSRGPCSCPAARSGTDHLLEHVLVLLLLALVEHLEAVQGGQRLLGGEDELVVGQLGIDVAHRVLRPLYRGDVVDFGGDLGGVLGVVVEIHELLGAGLVGRSL